jgi:hypothetical protein
MTTSVYMLVALITASGSCQEPQIIVQKMASLGLCHAAMNLATKAGGFADCVPLPILSPNARASHAFGHRRQQQPPPGSAGSEEVQQLNRAQLGRE